MRWSGAVRATQIHGTLVVTCEIDRRRVRAIPHMGPPEVRCQTEARTSSLTSKLA